MSNRDDAKSLEDLRREIADLRSQIADLKTFIDQNASGIDQNASGLDLFNNMQGDEDIAPGNGFVEVDRSAAKYPVIRFRADRLPSSGAYVSGDDTNIVFTPDGGVIKVDVYYS